jgi:hypothetical protein
MTLIKPLLDFFEKLDSPESKTTVSTQDVAAGSLYERTAVSGAKSKNGGTVIAGQNWAWTDKD